MLNRIEETDGKIYEKRLISGTNREDELTLASRAGLIDAPPSVSNRKERASAPH